jgi:hypothetical protein
MPRGNAVNIHIIQPIIVADSGNDRLVQERISGAYRAMK